MPQRFCVICRRRISGGSRCRRHAIRSPSNRAWHEPGAAAVRRKLLSSPYACCRICGSTTRLQVHHLVPARGGGQTVPSNLIVLCHDHQVKVERGEIELDG